MSTVTITLPRTPLADFDRAIRGIRSDYETFQLGLDNLEAELAKLGATSLAAAPAASTALAAAPRRGLFSFLHRA